MSKPPRSRLRRLATVAGLAVVALFAVLLVARAVFFRGPYQPVEALPATPIVDLHCHVAGLGAGGSGCFVSPALRDNWRFDFYLGAFGVTPRGGGARGRRGARGPVRDDAGAGPARVTGRDPGVGRCGGRGRFAGHEPDGVLRAERVRDCRVSPPHEPALRREHQPVSSGRARAPRLGGDERGGAGEVASLDPADRPRRSAPRAVLPAAGGARPAPADPHGRGEAPSPKATTNSPIRNASTSRCNSG